MADLEIEAESILIPVAAVAVAVLVALGAAWLLSAVFRFAARRWDLAGIVSRRARGPLRAVMITLAVWFAVIFSTEPASWWVVANQAFLITLIVCLAWLLARVALVVEEAVTARFRVDVPDNRHARRVHTQMQVLRRLVVAVIVIVAVSGILLTFPGMRAFGASLLASAGLVSIVAGLAAQTSLANVFAGMQIAFTDAVRVDDVVIADGEWGRIEEITLTYVVVRIWDDRRLVLPSTYFTTTPFQNWTRSGSALLGTVEIDVDWTVPVEAMREELHRQLQGTELWDGRAWGLQVTEATGGLVRVRALASATDAGTLFDLRCALREGLVSWVQAQGAGLPRTRLEPLERAGMTAGAPPVD